MKTKTKKQKHFGIIYRIKNRKTGRLILYVGQASRKNATCTDVEKLLRVALQSKKYSKRKKDRAVIKYIQKRGGIKNFECVLVRSYCGDTHKELKDTLNDREHFFIKKYKTYINENPNGLNETKGGSPHKELSKKSRKKLSASMIGKNKGKKRTSVQRRQMSYIRKKRCEDPAVRKKMSNASREAWADPILRKKQSKRMKDALKDPAVQKKMSERQKKRWENQKERKKLLEKMLRGDNHPGSKATICISPKWKKYRYGAASEAAQELTKRYGIKFYQRHISAVARGERSHHRNWTFSYE